MAIYNTGRYLEESIHSLLIQTIGYKEIQIIFMLKSNMVVLVKQEMLGCLWLKESLLIF